MAREKNGYVKKETMLLVALGAAVIGFLGGIVFSAYQGPAPVPVATAPQQAAPGPGGGGAGGGMPPQVAGRIVALEKEVAANPKNAGAWVELGNIWYDNNNPAKAIEAYEKSLAIRPGDPNVLTDLGVMYRRAGKPEQAIAAFDKAIAADPRHEVSRFNKGVVYIYDLKDLEQGLKAWEGLVATNPNAHAPDGKLVSKMISEFRAQMGKGAGSGDKSGK